MAGKGCASARIRLQGKYETLSCWKISDTRSHLKGATEADIASPPRIRGCTPEQDG